MTVRRSLSDKEIAGCFNSDLGRRYRVRLIGGADEPLYEPGVSAWSVIRYNRDYAASALHELAHWCIAGPARRDLIDYGYWYEPPPRSESAQARFAEAELPVQALESLLSEACGLPFRVSLDNLDGPPEFATGFSRQVRCRARKMKLSGRASALHSSLLRIRLSA
jgi:elongation factor P hydroxylase